MVEQGANVRIEITAADLKMFGEGITERAIMVYREEIESKNHRRRPIITHVR